MQDLLFRIVDTKSEHEHKIYTNGTSEGFGDGVIVVNYFDSLLATAIQKREHPQLKD